jgi:hypothetical protein
MMSARGVSSPTTSWENKTTGLTPLRRNNVRVDAIGIAEDVAGEHHESMRGQSAARDCIGVFNDRVPD